MVALGGCSVMPLTQCLSVCFVQEHVAMSVDVHKGLAKQLQAWCAERRVYLSARESIKSSDDAQVCLSVSLSVCPSSPLSSFIPHIHVHNLTISSIFPFL